jgi:hypothetical protein
LEDGTGKGFQEVVQYMDMLYRVALGKARNEELAQSLTQDALFYTM